MNIIEQAKSEVEEEELKFEDMLYKMVRPLDRYSQGHTTLDIEEVAPILDEVTKHIGNLQHQIRVVRSAREKFAYIDSIRQAGEDIAEYNKSVATEPKGHVTIRPIPPYGRDENNYKIFYHDNKDDDEKGMQIGRIIPVVNEDPGGETQYAIVSLSETLEEFEGLRFDTIDNALEVVYHKFRPRLTEEKAPCKGA